MSRKLTSVYLGFFLVLMTLTTSNARAWSSCSYSTMNLPFVSLTTESCTVPTPLYTDVQLGYAPDFYDVLATSAMVLDSALMNKGFGQVIPATWSWNNLWNTPAYVKVRTLANVIRLDFPKTGTLNDILKANWSAAAEQLRRDFSTSVFIDARLGGLNFPDLPQRIHTGVKNGVSQMVEVSNWRRVYWQEPVPVKCSILGVPFVCGTRMETRSAMIGYAGGQFLAVAGSSVRSMRVWGAPATSFLPTLYLNDNHLGYSYYSSIAPVETGIGVHIDSVGVDRKSFSLSMPGDTVDLQHRVDFYLGLKLN